MNSGALVIRPYEPTDLDAVIDIFQRAVRETASRHYDRVQINAWSQVDRSVWALRRLSRPTWLALMAGMPAGFTDLEPDGHLDMLFVHPAFGGRGVATALVTTVIDAAHELGLKRIFTEASITARPFFENCGFSVITSQLVERRGAVLQNFRMEKFLDQAWQR